MSTNVSALLSAPGVSSIVDLQYIPFGNAYFNNSGCGTMYSLYYDSYQQVCWNKQCGGAHPPADCFGDSVYPGSTALFCQHGQNECTANLIAGCAVALYPGATRFAPFLECFESNLSAHIFDPVNSSVPACAAATQLDSGAILGCANNKTRAAEILVANARATIAQVNMTGTPWVLVDGVPLGDDADLLGAVCDAFTGAPPAGCAKQRRASA